MKPSKTLVTPTDAEVLAIRGPRVVEPNPIAKGIRTKQRRVSRPTLEAFAEEMGFDLSDFKPAKPRKKKPGIQKIVVLNDLHCPTQCEDVIDRVIEEEAANADLLVIAGDLVDGYHFSTHPKGAREPWSLDFEIDETVRICRRLAEAFPKIRIMRGNHDERQAKRLYESDPGRYHAGVHRRFSNDGVTLIDGVARLLRDAGADIAITPAIRFGLVGFEHLHQVGDILFSHAALFRKLSPGAAREVANRAEMWAAQGHIKPFQILAQAHTHQFGVAFNSNCKRVIELGCACEYPPYVGSPQMQTTSGWWRGYHVFFQTPSGETLVNSTKHVMVRKLEGSALGGWIETAE